MCGVFYDCVYHSDPILYAFFFFSLFFFFFVFLMIRRPPRSTLDRSSAASDVYKRQDKNKADFDRLLEKVVDISLVFEPTSEEAVDIAFQQKSATSGFLRPKIIQLGICLLYTSPSPRDRTRYRMPSSA